MRPKSRPLDHSKLCNYNLKKGGRLTAHIATLPPDASMKQKNQRAKVDFVRLLIENIKSGEIVPPDARISPEQFFVKVISHKS